VNLNPPKGTRDFLPEEMIARERVIKIIKDTFEIYGFLPMETPAFERWEVLTKKCGEEIKNQIYGFEDKAGRKLGLRFDLTVPLARVIASHPTVPKPFKRYCISRVWRYEEPQAGRFREFWQADIDVIGIESLQADVECVSCAAEALIKLGIDDFSVFVNSRKVLEGVAESVGIESESVKLSVFRAIDKLEKIGENGVRKELEEIGLSAKQINGIFELLRLKSIEEAKEKLKDIEVAAKGVEELEEIYRFARCYGIENRLKFDISLARGLDYYTGPIFEFKLISGKSKLGTISAGGRYDNLIALFGSKPLPATGISLGIERIMEVLRLKNKLPEPKSKVAVFVANATEEMKEKAVEIGQMIRRHSIPCEVNITSRNLRKQLDYVNRRGIPYALIVGERELKEGCVVLRDMATGSESKIKIDEICSRLKGATEPRNKSLE